MFSQVRKMYANKKYQGHEIRSLVLQGREISFFMVLRVNFCKYRESGDSFKIFNFFIFCPNKAFSELFSKIQLKDPKALEFFQNRGKFENRHFGLPPPLKIDKNDAFSFRSCW